MGLKIGIQMDPLSTIIADHDTTFALMLGGQSRGHTLYHFLPENVSYNQGTIAAWSNKITQMEENGNIQTAKTEHIDLRELDIILLRQDPPFDMGYISNTHLLERIGDTTLVLNDPAEVRNAPEKLWMLDYEEFIPPTLISRDIRDIKLFHKEHEDIIVKPLYGMGGKGVFRLKKSDKNLDSLVEMFLEKSSEPLMMQRFLPEISKGDKRVILIDGTFAGVMNRMPELGGTRANMAAGGAAEAGIVTDRILEICNALKPELQERGLIFVGIDIIGDYLTEINVTSPTGLQEIEKFDGANLRAQFWQAAESMYEKYYQ